MTDFFIKQNDTSPLFQVQLLDGAGDPVNVTGANVRFHMIDDAGNVKVDEAMSVITPLDGIVRYTWTGSDTDTQGFYDAEVEVTFADTSIQTFPNYGAWTIHIDDDLA